MSKPNQTLILFFVSALCFISLIDISHSVEEDHFYVDGQVYCDTCRAQFITKASKFMKGATVRLECRKREGEELTFTIDGETDEEGKYHLPIDGDHEEEICEVNLISSPDPDCNEIAKDGPQNTVARVSVTASGGLASNERLANPLGFMKKEPLKECKKILEEMEVLPNQH